MQNPQQLMATLRAEIQSLQDAAKADAERIEWLASQMQMTYGRRELGYWQLKPFMLPVESDRNACSADDLRRAIDADKHSEQDEAL